jgi:hypothetical protein
VLLINTTAQFAQTTVPSNVCMLLCQRQNLRVLIEMDRSAILAD